MKATFVCAQLASCLQSPFNAENARGTKTGTSILDTSRRAKIVRCLRLPAQAACAKILRSLAQTAVLRDRTGVGLFSSHLPVFSAPSPSWQHLTRKGFVKGGMGGWEDQSRRISIENILLVGCQSCGGESESQSAWAFWKTATME